MQYCHNPAASGTLVMAAQVGRVYPWDLLTYFELGLRKPVSHDEAV